MCAASLSSRRPSTSPRWYIHANVLPSVSGISSRTRRVSFSSRLWINSSNPSASSPVAADQGYALQIAQPSLLQALPRCRIEQVDLVQRLDQPLLNRLIEAEIGEDVQHVVALCLGVGVMRIADVDDDIRFGDLFERGAESGNKMGRKVESSRPCPIGSLGCPEHPSRRIVGSRVANSMSPAVTDELVNRLNSVDFRRSYSRRVPPPDKARGGGPRDANSASVCSRRGRASTWQCAGRSAAGQFRAGFRLGRRGSQTRRADVRDVSRSAPDGIVDRSVPPARPAIDLMGAGPLAEDF